MVNIVIGSFAARRRAIISLLLTGSPRLVSDIRASRCGPVIRAAGVGVALNERPGAERFVGVDGDHAGAARQVGELAVFAGVQVGAP